MEREFQGGWPIFLLEEWLFLSNRCRETEVEIRKDLGTPAGPRHQGPGTRKLLEGLLQRVRGWQPLKDVLSNNIAT